MACVHVLVGQCGNQLGAHFLTALTDEARRCSDEDYASQISADHFRPAPTQKGIRRGGVSNGNSGHHDEPPLPRSVMIDMEPKVVESVVTGVNDGGAFQVRAEQCVTRDEGSGNNWAFGYYEQGRSRCDEIVESLRRQSEARGAAHSFHIVHSVAGGTGSGVGCLVSDAIRVEFPRALLLHTAVWPFATGEVVTQWYNCVLAMSALRESADAVFVAHNDDFDVSARPLQKAVNGRTSEVSFDTINHEIGRLLLDLHLPKKLYPVPSTAPEKKPHPQSTFPASRTTSSTGAMASLRCGGLTDVVEAVALDPALKFFSGLALPVTPPDNRVVAPEATSWYPLLCEASRRTSELFVPAPSGDNNTSNNLSTAFIEQRPLLWSLRGPAACSEGLAHLREVLSRSTPTPDGRELYVPPSALLLHEERLLGRRAHVSVFGPTHNIGLRLASALERAEDLLRVSAYVHHFSRYGVGEEELRDAVVRMWDTAAAYGAA
ncbi:delta tubulin [Trypanosoma brucei brucei TREU927]|uniref:Tubulin delta chain n=1 Tax=Trypanosoma brucei brucei (strain 927/4 GUTat10.1) TaxID=185431 RepID=Q383I6_TRYB2|nr:delta tubulin [Trypanosoma brucei brucei TREU927]EAN80045.1 delta tubulin [Trypanosoma brucei brucei TREU927]